MFGLAGQTNLEKAQADEIVDAVNDLFNARVAAVRETDEVKKTELVEAVERYSFDSDTLRPTDDLQLNPTGYYDISESYIL